MDRRSLLAPALALALALAGSATAADRGAPPAPDCADARAVREVVQSDDHTLAVRLADESRFRIDLAARCPGIGDAPGTKLVSPAGWACGRRGEAVVGGGRACPIAHVARIDARAFSAHALQAGRAPRPDVLDAVTVKGARSRGFVGSPAYCFNTNHLRAWHEDADGIVVEVSPLRSAGHRRYRVELGASCQGLSDASNLSFRSGVGGAMICGHAGDRAMFQTDLEAYEMASQFEGPIGRRSRVGRGVEGLPAAVRGCPVAQVYPVESVPRRPVAQVSPAR